ncbi:MAG: hypothetical protein AB7I50_25045, partial [Vicinamibacterales bacterium]
AYTLWYEDLVLETTIETGTLDADWSFHPWTDGGVDGEGTFSPTSGSGAGKPVVAIVYPATTLEGGVATLLGINGVGNGAHNFLNSNFPLSKPQPVCSGTLGNTDLVPTDANDVAEDNKLQLVAAGLYPYAGCEWEIDITNDGTVPFHIAVQSVDIDVCATHTSTLPPTTSCDDWDETNLETDGGPWTRAILGPNRETSGPEYEKCQAVIGADWTYRNSLPEILTVSNAPVQIHANESIVCRLILVLDQNADAEGKLYRTTVSWRTFQWNETPNDALINNNPNP